jgi:transcription-repair coupling factor (superfamily II helicase)
VPEASLVIGHGQMHEDDLEQVMAEFAGGAYDVLLCTTIIESGLDIPNANTIIIDRADTFGLAQLHQLRGRVGRGANRAYAYLFHQRPRQMRAPGWRPSPADRTGRRLLHRHARSGNCGAATWECAEQVYRPVGFHLYTQLLAQSVQRLKTEQPAATDSQPPEPGLQLSMLAPAITVDLQLPAHIPVEYIPEMAVRLQLYRRLADLHSLDSVAELDSELIDRFGPLPLEVRNLLFQVRVKLLAGAANAVAIKTQEEQIVIRLPYLAGVDRMGLQTYLGNGARVARTGVWLRREPDHDPL